MAKVFVKVNEGFNEMKEGIAYLVSILRLFRLKISVLPLTEAIMGPVRKIEREFFFRKLLIGIVYCCHVSAHLNNELSVPRLLALIVSFS